MKAKATKSSKAARKPIWRFCLYVADRAPSSVLAIKNLNAFCEKEFPGQCEVEVIDVLAHPETARKENIVALPTLVRKEPVPMRRVIGNLGDTPRVISGLELRVSPH